MMSVSVQCEHLCTILLNPFLIGVGVGQCERIIKPDYKIFTPSEGDLPFSE